MQIDKDGKTREILIRLVATFALAFFAAMIWMIACRVSGTTLRELLFGISSGLLVLGVAGIWVSYFAERQAGKNISRKVDDRFSILTSCFDAGISNVFKSRHDDSFRDKLMVEMRKSRDPVRVLAVAAREFLHEGQGDEGFDYHIIRSLSQENELRFLLLHPWCEQAVSRGLREDPQHSTFDRYKETRLFQDVTRSCDTLVEWGDSGSKVRTRLYKVMPSCFLILTSDVVFIEEYQFGTGGRASGKVPVIEALKGTRLYEQLEGHFEYVWDTASQYPLSLNLAETIRNPSAADVEQFERIVRFLRPDLFIDDSGKKGGAEQSHQAYSEGRADAPSGSAEA
ncbi:MAG TPA: hypothetical protein HPP77_00905 [Candidatus Hydrogenedentes bacterium]|nr:hypothetical protein [Candidatus Hydrogenedentota bacterium]